MHFVYIIYSDKLNRYYVGETEQLDLRLEQHTTGFFKNSYTAKTTDWKLHLVINCENRTKARKIEMHIKRMKSIKYIQDLKKYPEIVLKLCNKY